MNLDTRKPDFWGLRTTKAQSYAAQTSLHRLISVFVIHFLESIISKFATGEIYIFQLVSVTEEIDFNLALSET